MRFLVDMPLSPVLAGWLRERGHDAVHVGDLGMGAAADAEILALARNEARTVVTADLDYPRLLAVARVASPSLILFRDGNWSDAEVVAGMESLLRSVSERDIETSILVVERDRVRRRRLPID